MGEIITNSDLQNFGLEAVGKWVIFCYFSTGRKYPAVVYDSYIGGLIKHIELITWGKQLLKTMNIPKGATVVSWRVGISIYGRGRLCPSSPCVDWQKSLRMASRGAGVYKTMGKWLETLRRASVASQGHIWAFPSPCGGVEVWGRCGGNIKTRWHTKKATPKGSPICGGGHTAPTVQPLGMYLHQLLPCLHYTTSPASMV